MKFSRFDLFARSKNVFVPLIFSQPCLVRHQVRVQDGKSVPQAPSRKYLSLGLWNDQMRNNDDKYRIFIEKVVRFGSASLI